MKHINWISITFTFLVMIGCATSSYTVGKDFKSEHVANIEKEKTTSADLIKMFGQPFSKTVISKNEEKWIYTYASGTAKAQSYIVTMKVETSGIQKTLDILLKNGIVINYTFTEGQNPYRGTVQ